MKNVCDGVWRGAPNQSQETAKPASVPSFSDLLTNLGSDEKTIYDESQCPPLYILSLECLRPLPSNFYRHLCLFVPPYTFTAPVPVPSSLAYQLIFTHITIFFMPSFITPLPSHIHITTVTFFYPPPAFLPTILVSKENVRKRFESHRKRAPQVASRIGQNERSCTQI